MSELLERIENGEVLVCDGAMGTFLMSHGLEPGASPDAFNLSHPELLSEIARLYSAAGADIVICNTLGATALNLEHYGLAGQMEEINRAGVQAARAGAGAAVFVSGDIGPTGKLLKPYGDTEPAAVLDSYRGQAWALTAAGVDAFSIETMTDLNEAVFAVKAAKEVAPELPVLATMTFDRTPRGFFTIMGASVERAVEGLLEAGADLIGSNCGYGSEEMLAIAREFAQHTDLPLVIQPNAGLPEMKDGGVFYPETPEFMADKAEKFIAAGVRVLGACCGSTPEHIRAIRAAVDGVRGHLSRDS